MAFENLKVSYHGPSVDYIVHSISHLLLLYLTYPQWTRGHTVLHPGFVILLRYCRSAYVHTLRTSALQNHKSETQNSFGPRVPSSGGWQGNGMRRTGRTPLAVNAAIHQKTVPGACVPLSAEGKLRHVILLTEPAIPSGNICELAGILL